MELKLLVIFISVKQIAGGEIQNAALGKFRKPFLEAFVDGTPSESKCLQIQPTLECEIKLYSFSKRIY